LPANSITLTASGTIVDGDGDEATDSQALDISGAINFNDDTPTAVDDGPAAVTEDGTSVVSGNVLSNDDANADQVAAFVSWGSNQANLDAIAALNTYGTLVQNGDGTWSYTLDNSLAATQALTAANSTNYVLNYTMADADGDQANAILTITINGANDSASVVTAAATGPDATVYEAGLNPDGSDAGSDSETVAGSFTVSATDGILNVVIGGTTFTLAEVQAFAGTDTVSTGEGTLTLTGYTGDAFGGTINYSYTLDATIDNDSIVPTGDDAVTLVHFDDSVALTVNGVGGSTAGDDLVIRAIDDVPVSLNPTTSHLKDVATSPDVVQLLNFAAGADGVDSVLFDTSLQGTAAVDAEGNELTFNGTGAPLYVNFSSDGTQLQFVTKNLDGTLNTTDVKFFIDLNQDGQTYSVHSEGIINNGTAVSSSTIETVGGGNKAWKAFINLGGTEEDAFLTTKTSGSVNTNNGEIGISGGNSFEAGEGLRIDLLNGVTTTGSGGGETFSITGPHNLTNSFRQIVSTVNPGGGGTGANITVSAIIANDFLDTGNTASNLFYNDADDVLVNLSTTDITVYDANGFIVTMPVGTLIDETDGSITIIGLQKDWTFEIKSETDFNAVKIEAATGTSAFKLGVFSYGEDSDGQPIELDYGIIGTDGDGDFVTGSLGVNLYANGSTFEGDDNANILTGTDNAEFLLGRGGDDILFGGGGDDLLIGGYGNDIMDGGAGKDTFVFSLAANSGNDTINNFEAGTDKLSFIDILDTDGSGTFSLNDVINNVSDSGGNVTVALTNGGSITLAGLGDGSVNDITSLQTLLGTTNITFDVS